MQTVGVSKSLTRSVSSTTIPEEVLDHSETPKGINYIGRGAATAEGSPAMPAGLTITLIDKTAPLPASLGSATQMARVSWTMPSLPKDLAGYYVDVARSPEGPWTRASRDLVAWWETHYTLQGIAIGPEHFSSQADCLSFRVIAVDENGNQTTSAAVTNNPNNLNCSRTPDAPQNLRASTDSTTCLPHVPTQAKGVRLDWDGVSGAQQYSVYRLLFDMYYTYSYETQRQDAIGGAGSPQSYLECDDWASSPSDPNHYCPFAAADIYDHPCQVTTLEAYFVTARGVPKGESPRSNLVFWDVTKEPGYAKLESSTDPDVMLASLSDSGASGPYCSEAFADQGRVGRSAANRTSAVGVCDASSGDVQFVPNEVLSGVLLADLGRRTTASEVREGESDSRSHPSRPDESGTIGRPRQLTRSPMVHLGSLADPPWIVLNLHTDHLGSVRVVTHTVTGAASRHDFFPFGEEVASEFSYNTHQYTGHERDSSSALHYMRARYFSDSVLRFLSPDRLSGDLTDPQGWNLYEYAGNSPMVFVDDTGWAKRIAVSSQYSLILSPGMRDSAGKVTEMPHGHFVKNSTGEGAGKIKINGEFEPGAARPPGKATIAAGLKAVIKRFGVAIVIAAVVDAEVAAGTVTYTSPIGDDPLIMWREYLEGMERLGYVVDWRFG